MQNTKFGVRVPFALSLAYREGVRRTEYPLKRSESGVPKRGGGIASLICCMLASGDVPW